MAERDFQGEMADRIAAATAGSGWAVPQIANRLYDELMEKDQELLGGWLGDSALAFLTKAVGDHVRGERLRARQAAARDEFARAAENAEAGDKAALGLFMATHVVGPDFTRKRAMEMTGTDHRYVATRYERHGVEALMLGAFHEAVAEKVGDRKTEEVLTASQYASMYRSIVKPSARTATA